MRGVPGSVLAAAAALCCLSGSALAQSDVIVGEIVGTANNSADGTFDSYAIGTTSCNRGTVPLLWYTGGTDNRHPVIGQNLFRLHNGRFEQIGQAWLKHGFTALQGGECAGDPGFPHSGCSATAGTTLGVGCSDPYGAGLNNGQSGLGPKWQVNASTGIAPYPWNFAGDVPNYSGSIDRRLRVRLSDISGTTYAGAQYYVEAQYVAVDDAAANTDNNNASYRRAVISPTPSTGMPTESSMSLTASTVRELPAIYAWQVADPTVQIQAIDVPGDGRYILACKVSGPVGGLYTYEYALHNLNSDRCAGSFSVPFPTAANAGASTARGFTDVEYHSGEENDTPANPALDDWAIAVTGSSVTWSGPSYSGTPASYVMDGSIQYKLQQVSTSVPNWTKGAGNDHTANVLRWGTLFNFRFQSAVAPAAGQVQVGLWRPGTPNLIYIPIQTPGGATSGTPSTGPCCTAGNCTITTAAACTGVFGTVGAACTPSLCALTGACCNSSGTCSITAQVDCVGTYQGDDTVCSPNPCPQPTGACCSSGNCTVTTATGCSGVYQGNNTTCSPNNCPNLSNDLCQNSITLIDGIPVNGSTLGAGDEGTASCGSSSASPDVWYTYTPAVSGSFTVDLCTAPAANQYDTAMAIFTGNCVPTNQLACNDDSCGLLSSITINGSAGTLYRIRVSGWNGRTGDFVITVTGGLGGPSGACCNGSTCSTTTQPQCAGTFTTGGSCSPNPCGGGGVNGSCCFNDQSCSVTLQSGCSGTWTSGATCTPNICPPANDNCSGRIGLGLGATPFSTVNATTDGIDHPALCNFFNNPGIASDIWFNHPSQITGTLTISTCGSAYDTELAVYSGPECGNWESRLIACNDDATECGNTRSFLTISVVAGQSYVIRVGGYNGATGTGTLTLTATPTATGACCAGDGSCSVTTAANCAAGYQGDGSSCSPNACPQPTGACCADGICSVTTATTCPGDFQGVGVACSPTICPQPTGACCVASACSITTNAACSGSWQGAGSACGPTGNPTTCCPANYNGAGGVTVQDIFDFLAGYFGNDLAADFNSSGGLSVQDIFDFLAAYFTGCPG